MAKCCRWSERRHNGHPTEQKADKQELNKRQTEDYYSETSVMEVGNVFMVTLVVLFFLKEIMKPYEVPQLVNCDSMKA